MAKVDYLAVLKTAEQFTADDTPWDTKFKNLVALPIKDQADAFKLRFALQFAKQGVDPKEMVRVVNAVKNSFIEKSKSGNGKNIKYGGVEFGDIIKEFGPESQMSFVQRKDRFKDFDLDNNGVVDICEFLLYMYKEHVLKGYLSRYGITEIDTETEAQALIKEFVNIAVLVDTQLDQQILDIAACNRDHEANMQKIKDDAKSEVQKRQLANNLKNAEKKHEEQLHNFFTPEKVEKAKIKLLKMQEEHLKDIEESLYQEFADSLAPKKNLVMPVKP